MSRALALGLLVGAGCGRIGFDDRTQIDADLARVCAPSYQPVANLSSRYRVVTSSHEWLEAEANCEQDGGHLVITDTQAELAYVFAQGGGWVGVSDHAIEGVFVTVAGETPRFAPWDQDEPNNANGVEDCVHVRDPLGLWNDNGCGVNLSYVCECDGARLPATPTFCDTNADEHCGACGAQCPPGTTCQGGQVCADPS